MVQQMPAQNATISGHRWWGGPRSALIAVGVVCAVLMIGALLLWLHYGTAVFFEMIASGVAACF
jgi:type IV secretory pathway TrbD component